MVDRRQRREGDSKRDKGRPEHQLWPHGPWESETRGEEVKREESLKAQEKLRNWEYCI